MLTRNINYIQKNIFNVVYMAVNNMANASYTSENDLNAELVRVFGQDLKKTMGDTFLF